MQAAAAAAARVGARAVAPAGVLAASVGARASAMRCGCAQVPRRTFASSSSSSMVRPRRALLYMPGSNPKMLDKAPTLAVDSVCMDLEDAVAHNKKEEARHFIINALKKHTFERSERLVRINPIGSGYEQADLQTILSASVLPDGLVVPKVQDASHLHYVEEQIERYAGARGQHLILIAIVETAHAMLRVHEIARSSARLRALVFGADDYAADVGATRTASNAEVSFARNTVLLSAKAHELQAIDLVNIHFHDEPRLVAECEEAFRMGFTGKQIIHPKQIEPVQRCFAPSAARIAWATKIIDANAQHERAGMGAFTLDNQMIDLPTVKQAQAVLDRARACGISLA